MTSLTDSATISQRETARRNPGEDVSAAFRVPALYGMFVRTPPSASLPYTPAPYAARGHRRSAERRKIHALQRADADPQGGGRELSVLHDRAERRRGDGARPEARASGEDLPVRAG